MNTSSLHEYEKVPEPTLRRLPWYLSNIKLMKEKGERYVSSTQISKEINIESSQIAKDLSYVKVSGRTRVGYEIDELIRVLEEFLGFTNMHKAFLFGAGSLGRALLGDSGLQHFGLPFHSLPEPDGIQMGIANQVYILFIFHFVRPSHTIKPKYFPVQ